MRDKIMKMKDILKFWDGEIEIPRVLTNNPCRGKHVHAAVPSGASADLRLLVHSFYQLKRADRRTARALASPSRAVRYLTGISLITVIGRRSIFSKGRKKKEGIGRDLKGHIGANQVCPFVFIKAILLRFVSFATKWLHSGGIKAGGISRGDRTDTVKRSALCCRGSC